ncbi:MAG: hypothetical protein AAF411_05085, partial [Myxococcota bacterium]
FKDKPAAAVQKIVEGKMDKFYSTVALLEQCASRVDDDGGDAL